MKKEKKSMSKKASGANRSVIPRVFDRSTILAVSVLLFLLAGVFSTFSSGVEREFVPTGVSKGIGFLTEEWRAVAYLSLMIVAFATAAAFMLGRGLNVLTVETWAKNEFYQVIASALLLTALIFALEFSEFFANDLAESLTDIPSQPNIDGASVRCENGVAQVYSAQSGEWQNTIEATCGSALRWRYNERTARWTESRGAKLECEKPCYFFVARAWLGSTFEKMASFLKGIASFYASLLFLDYSGVGLSVNVLAKFWIEISGNPFSGHGALANSLEIVASLITKAMLAVKFQELLLLYIQDGIYPLFVAAGFILRCFWFTRKLGGLLIAMGIGFYFVMPLMYTLGWYTVEFPVMKYETTMDEGIIPPGATGDVNALNARAKGDVFGMDQEKVSQYLFTKFDDSGRVTSPGALDLAARLVLVSFGIPLLAIFVWVGFVKGLSPALGGDVEIAGLTRIL